MEQVQKKKNPLGVIVVIIAAIIGIWFLFDVGLEQQAAGDLKNIEIQVAQDAEKSFQIAVEGGDAMDAYVQAGLVAAAYLQANDADNYKKWKEIEKTLEKRSLFGGGLEQQAMRDLKNIEIQVARDFEKSFQIAVEGGNAMDAYVQAGLVAAAYLQANDADNYKKWKEVEKNSGEKGRLGFLNMPLRPLVD